MWREGLGAYKIITEDKKGYCNHPAVKEFEHAPQTLLTRLLQVYFESKNRGYSFNIKLVDANKLDHIIHKEPKIIEWQSLEKQIEVLHGKNCECKV